MKLRTGLQISAIFPVILAIMVSLGLLLRSNLIRSARARSVIAEEAVVYIAELQSMAYACLLSADTSAQKEWQKKADLFKRFLGEQRPRDVIEEIALDNIRENQEAMDVSFTQLMVLRRRHGLTIEQSGPDSQEYGRLKQELEGRTLAMLDEAFKFSRTSNRNAASFEDTTDKLVLVFIGVVAMLMAMVILSTSRSAVKRLTSLKDVADQISDGDFRHRLDSSGGDEISDSFRAFNKMLARLDLAVADMGKTSPGEKALENHKRAANAARESNIRLADALTKLKRAQHQIILHERLHALEQVAAGVAKDFADSLTPIIGASDFLLDDSHHLDDRENLVSQLKTINAAGREAMKKLRDLSDVFSESGAAESECVDINVAVQKAIDITEPKWNPVSHPDLPISCTVNAAQVPMVEGTELDLTEAVVHLISNAVEAMPKGGAITVATMLEGKDVVLTVADDGEGMTDEVRSRCLEPFFSTRGADHSGMGMPTALAIVGRYNGSLKVDSVMGEGATVIIRLPVCGKGKGFRKKEDALKMDRKLRILVVEDEEWVRNVLSRGLAREGHTVEEAINGNDGIGKSHTGEFDLVILDRAMPDMAGDDVAAILSHNHPGLPILMLTGFGDMMNKEHIQPKGVHLVVSKPITMQGLRDAVAKTLLLAKTKKS